MPEIARHLPRSGRRLFALFASAFSCAELPAADALARIVWLNTGMLVPQTRWNARAAPGDLGTLRSAATGAVDAGFGDSSSPGNLPPAAISWLNPADGFFTSCRTARLHPRRPGGAGARCLRLGRGAGSSAPPRALHHTGISAFILALPQPFTGGRPTRDICIQLRPRRPGMAGPPLPFHQPARLARHLADWSSDQRLQEVRKRR
jgi:hypothetical protein